MKLLESLNLDNVNDLLTGSWRFHIEPRVENYSCKMVAEDKRMFKEMCRQTGNQHQMLSPPQTSLLGLSGDESPNQMLSPLPHNGVGGGYQSTPILLNHSTSLSTSEGEDLSGKECDGSHCATISTKTLFYLISTLNASFNPDYDFSCAKSEEFCREPEADVVVYAINEILNTYLDSYPDMKDGIWEVINDEIVINECSVYSYRPDHQGDPYSEGCIASFNYFFFNKNLKRVLFFSVKISSPNQGTQTTALCLEDDDEFLDYD